MNTLTLKKVAMIRVPGYPQGVPAPMYLNCPCGIKPMTDLETGFDVVCRCGRKFSYNGYVIEGASTND